VVFSPDGKFLASAGDDAMIPPLGCKNGKGTATAGGTRLPCLLSCCFPRRQASRFRRRGRGHSDLGNRRREGEAIAAMDIAYLVGLLRSPFLLTARCWLRLPGSTGRFAFGIRKQVKRSIHRPVIAVRLSPFVFLNGDRELISLGEDRKALLWDLSTGAERRRLFDGHSSPATGKKLERMGHLAG